MAVCVSRCFTMVVRTTCQQRPSCVSKQTYYASVSKKTCACVKRDLCMCQRIVRVSKETFACVKGLYCGEDDAEAADRILCAVLSRSSGVRLHGAAPLYLHCGAEFVAVMQQPQLLVSRQSVLASLGQGEESFITNSDMSAFPFVILGTPWKLPSHACGWDRTKCASKRVAVVGGSGQLQTVTCRT